MSKSTKLGLFTLFCLSVLLLLAHLFSSRFSATFNFDFSASNQQLQNKDLEKIVKRNLEGKTGTFAIYIESLATDSAKLQKKYALNETELFPAASLYKLVLLAAVLKEVENQQLDLDDVITGNKQHLVSVFGGVDFGYEEAPATIRYKVEEALERVGRISDNFAAIMLTEKLRQVRTQRNGDNKLLIEMAQMLEMKQTNFDSDPISISALDVAEFFRKLYFGEVVSKSVSEKIISLLSLSNINNRIPALLPEGIKTVHKTGELARVRHDAGIVYLDQQPFLIVLLSKDLKYEDDTVETMAQISKDVFDFFNTLSR